MMALLSRAVWILLNAALTADNSLWCCSSISNSSSRWCCYCTMFATLSITGTLHKQPVLLYSNCPAPGRHIWSLAVLQAMSSFFMHSFDLHPVQLLMNIESGFLSWCHFCCSLILYSKPAISNALIWKIISPKVFAEINWKPSMLRAWYNTFRSGTHTQ